MSDVFEVYDINSKELISNILAKSTEFNINIHHKTARQMFFKLEDNILDKFTLKVLYGIENEQFFTAVTNLYTKMFNRQTDLNYIKGDMIISKLLDLGLDLDNKFIIDIKNKNIIGKLTEANFNVIKIKNKLTLSKEDQQKIFDVCNSL